ncbi:lysozyme inhibitor LprI family protein [Roseinatronobacter sp. NSM]|uniref:lysozyme inhibitor LprI family protein n=1 Tax=Roseinatronobacter sp. NSM TaxID=3457785 RepID=UPI004036867E
MRLIGCLITLMAAPAAATGLRFDATPTEICLADVSDGAQSYECIGRAATDCMKQPGGETTVGMGFCLDAELNLWDGKLNGAYQALRADLTAQDAGRGDAAISLSESARDMQRAWIGFRDARCSFEAAQWHGGTGASPAFLGCAMTMTAEQTLYLWSLLHGAR